MDIISVIVPIYNVEQYLEKCIDSILNQTYRNLEVILVDDGSPDNCPAICDEYAKKDNRITVIHNTNEGVSVARNTGISKATGKYIMFVDSDDYCMPTLCADLFEAITRYDAELAVGCHYEGYQKVKKVKNSKNAVLVLNQKNFWDKWRRNELKAVPWCKLYKRDIIIKNSIFFPEGWHPNEDVLFNIMYEKYIKKAVVVKKKLYYKNFNTKSVMKTLSDKTLKSMIRSYDEIIRYCEQNYNEYVPSIMAHAKAGKSRRMFQLAEYYVITKNKSEFKKVISDARKYAWDVLRTPGLPIVRRIKIYICMLFFPYVWYRSLRSAIIKVRLGLLSREGTKQ